LVLTLALLSAFIPFGSPPLKAADRYPEEFRAALGDQERGDWQKSVESLNQALRKKPEDGGRARRYSTIYISYLPLYYLGLALYKQGDCAGALKEWDQSLSAGFVQATEKYEALLRYQAECRRKVH
jgi:tetratricopeptide (TPR) repeat protein